MLQTTSLPGDPKMGANGEQTSSEETYRWNTYFDAAQHFILNSVGINSEGDKVEAEISDGLIGISGSTEAIQISSRLDGVGVPEMVDWRFICDAQWFQVVFSRGNPNIVGVRRMYWNFRDPDRTFEIPEVVKDENFWSFARITLDNHSIHPIMALCENAASIYWKVVSAGDIDEVKKRDYLREFLRKVVHPIASREDLLIV